MFDTVEKLVPLSGVAIGFVVWLRQYLIQQRLTSEAVTALREDNNELREILGRYQSVYGPPPAERREDH